MTTDDIFPRPLLRRLEALALLLCHRAHCISPLLDFVPTPPPILPAPSDTRSDSTPPYAHYDHSQHLPTTPRSTSRSPFVLLCYQAHCISHLPGLVRTHLLILSASSDTGSASTHSHTPFLPLGAIHLVPTLASTHPFVRRRTFGQTTHHTTAAYPQQNIITITPRTTG